MSDLLIIPARWNEGEIQSTLSMRILYTRNPLVTMRTDKVK